MSEDEVEIRVATADERRLGLDCLRCGSRVVDQGTWDLRTGGTSGGWSVLFGGWADLGEDTVRLAVTACPSCGHLEFRAPSSG